MSLSGLPHSEILGSKPVCGSPKLIAAYHVLHRLLAPRHSPYALSSLTIFIFRTQSCRLARQPFAHCVCVVEKLPFAGYSIVKEHENCGEYRARTGDLLVANQALSQLS